MNKKALRPAQTDVLCVYALKHIKNIPIAAPVFKLMDIRINTFDYNCIIITNLYDFGAIVKTIQNLNQPSTMHS